MRWMFACAAVLAAGCFPVQPNPWERPGIVMGTEARREQDRAKAMWEGRGDPRADLKKNPANVIGGESALGGGAAARAPSRRSPPSAKLTSGELAREVEVLAARVDRLERLVASGGAPGALTSARSRLAA